MDKDRSALTSLSQYEAKIALLSTEFERLNKIVEEKNQEVREKDRTIGQLRRDLGQLGTQLQEKDQVIDNLRVKMNQPVQGGGEELKVEIRNLNSYIEEL